MDDGGDDAACKGHLGEEDLPNHHGPLAEDDVEPYVMPDRGDDADRMANVDRTDAESHAEPKRGRFGPKKAE